MLLTLRRRVKRLEDLVDRLYPAWDEEENEFFGMSDEEVDAKLRDTAVAGLAATNDPDHRELWEAVIEDIDCRDRERATWRPEWRAYVERSSREDNSHPLPRPPADWEDLDVRAMTEQIRRRRPRRPVPEGAPLGASVEGLAAVI